MPRAPDEADHRKALQRVAVQQVLRIAICPNRRKGLRQPVVLREQAFQQRPALGQQTGLVLRRPHQGRQPGDQLAQRGHSVGGLCLLSL